MSDAPASTPAAPSHATLSRMARVMFSDAATQLRARNISLVDRALLWSASEGFDEYPSGGTAWLQAKITGDHAFVRDMSDGADGDSLTLRSLIDAAFFLAGSRGSHAPDTERTDALILRYKEEVESADYDPTREERVFSDAAQVRFIRSMRGVVAVGVLAALAHRAYLSVTSSTSGDGPGDP